MTPTCPVFKNINTPSSIVNLSKRMFNSLSIEVKFFEKSIGSDDYICSILLEEIAAKYPVYLILILPYDSMN